MPENFPVVNRPHTVKYQVSGSGFLQQYTVRTIDGVLHIRTEITASSKRKSFEARLKRLITLRPEAFHASHMVGAGFGRENRYGIYWAPSEINLEYQNSGIEKRIRELRDLKDRRYKLFVKMEGKTVPGTRILREVIYQLELLDTRNISRSPVKVYEASINIEYNMEAIRSKDIKNAVRKINIPNPEKFSGWGEIERFLSPVSEKSKAISDKGLEDKAEKSAKKSNKTPKEEKPKSKKAGSTKSTKKIEEIKVIEDESEDDQSENKVKKKKIKTKKARKKQRGKKGKAAQASSKEITGKGTAEKGLAQRGKAEKASQNASKAKPIPKAEKLIITKAINGPEPAKPSASAGKTVAHVGTNLSSAPKVFGPSTKASDGMTFLIQAAISINGRTIINREKDKALKAYTKRTNEMEMLQMQGQYVSVVMVMIQPNSDLVSYYKSQAQSPPVPLRFSHWQITHAKNRNNLGVGANRTYAVPPGKQVTKSRRKAPTYVPKNHHYISAAPMIFYPQVFNFSSDFTGIYRPLKTMDSRLDVNNEYLNRELAIVRTKGFMIKFLMNRSSFLHGWDPIYLESGQVKMISDLGITMALIKNKNQKKFERTGVLDFETAKLYPGDSSINFLVNYADNSFSTNTKASQFKYIASTEPGKPSILLESFPNGSQLIWVAESLNQQKSEAVRNILMIIENEYTYTSK